MPFTPLRARPEKVATPDEKVPEVPPAAMEPPVPEAMDALAAARVDRGDHVAAGVLDLDHGLGGEGRAGVASVLEGSVVMTSWVAAPVDTVMVFDTAVVSAPSENVRV